MAEAAEGEVGDEISFQSYLQYWGDWRYMYHHNARERIKSLVIPFESR